VLVRYSVLSVALQTVMCNGCTEVCVIHYLQVQNLWRSFFTVMLPNCLLKQIRQSCAFVLTLSRPRFHRILHLHFHGLVVFYFCVIFCYVMMYLEVFICSNCCMYMSTTPNVPEDVVFDRKLAKWQKPIPLWWKSWHLMKFD